jgi:hypothetical protein
MLVAPSSAGYRHGDDVVIEMTDKSTVFGQHLFESRDEFVVEHPKRDAFQFRGNLSLPLAG